MYNGLRMYNGMYNGLRMYNGMYNGLRMFNGMYNGLRIYNGMYNDVYIKPFGWHWRIWYNNATIFHTCELCSITWYEL